MSRNQGCLQLDGSSSQSFSDSVPVPVSFLSLGRSQGVGPKQGARPRPTQLRPVQILTAAHLSLLEADAHPLRATPSSPHLPRCSPP